MEVHGQGTVTICKKLTTKELRAAYGRDMIDFGDDVVAIEEENLLDLIIDHDQAFESIFVDGETEDALTLFFDPCEKYNEALALQTLNLLAPIAIEGQINYEGEDGRMWCLHLDKDGFHRYKGQVSFACDYPVCNQDMCAFNVDGRCKLSCLRKELSIGFAVEKGRVVSCDAYIHVNSALGFARKKLASDAEKLKGRGLNRGR